MKKHEKRMDRMHGTGAQTAGKDLAVLEENAFAGKRKHAPDINFLDEYMPECMADEVEVPWGTEEEMLWELDPKADGEAYEEAEEEFCEEVDGEKETPNLAASLSLETLEHFITDIYRRCQLYWEVIIANDLKDEACMHYSEYIGEEPPLDPLDLIAVLYTSTK